MNEVRGDLLLERIRNGSTGDDANDLLLEFYNGYPVANLSQLLQSDNDSAIKAGIWIASELGEIAAPLMSAIAPLLNHPLRYVRFFAVDSVLALAGEVHGEVIASAARLIEDGDEAVRWKATHFLAKATPRQLRAGLRHTTDIRLAALIKWLLNATTAKQVNALVAAIDNPERSKRLIAAAAAARIADDTLVPIQHAACSKDPEVASFAQSVLNAGSK